MCLLDSWLAVTNWRNLGSNQKYPQDDVHEGQYVLVHMESDWHSTLHSKSYQSQWGRICHMDIEGSSEAAPRAIV